MPCKLKEVRVATAAALKLKSIQIQVEGIGPVLIQKSARAKRLSISVRPVKGVRVAVPLRVSFEQAEQLVLSKAAWIRHHLSQMKQHESQLTVFRPDAPFRTQAHELKLLPHQKPELQARIAGGFVTVFYPEHLQAEDAQVQQFIRAAVEEAYRREAKQFLPQRVAYFAKKFGFTFRNIVIKNSRTRWGSCSATNNINLNLHLMRLPAHLRDYVILHELAHTVEKNHGPHFWALLDRISGNARGLDKELKAYRIAIF